MVTLSIDDTTPQMFTQSSGRWLQLGDNTNEEEYMGRKEDGQWKVCSWI